MEKELVKVRNIGKSPVTLIDSSGIGHHLHPTKKGGEVVWKKVPRECLNLTVNRKALKSVEIDPSFLEKVRELPETVIEDHSDITPREISIVPLRQQVEAPSPVVSVIVVNKDYTKFLRDCVDSILAQTYKDFELVILDYGSSELEYIKEIALLDSRIKIIFDRSNNVQVARNSAVKYSTGKYLVVVDADVRLKENYLQVMVSELAGAAENVAYVYCNFTNHFLQDGRTSSNKFYPFSISKLTERNFGSMCSLVKREFFVGFDTEVRRLQDWDLWISIYENTHGIGLWVDEFLFDHYMEGLRNISKRVTWQAGVATLREKHKLFFDAIKGSGNEAVDIIIPTFNNAAWTAKCIRSIIRCTTYPYRIIWVDNGSNSEDIQEVESVIKLVPHIKIMNESNLGFVKAVNQGMKFGNSRYVVLLNNDVIVSDRWLERMIGILETDPQIAFVGPVTESAWEDEKSWQSVTNLKEKSQTNKDYEELFSLYPDFSEFNSIEEYSKAVYAAYGDSIHRIRSGMLAFFCTLMRRSVIKEIGYLDEEFGVGLGDDDEYCYRARKAGYHFALAKGVFVFHNHQIGRAHV